MDPQLYRQLVYWITAYAAATRTLENNTIAAVLRLLSRLHGNAWYQASTVDAVVSQAVSLSQTGSTAVEGLANQYVVNYTDALGGDSAKGVRAVKTELDPYRLGADPTAVYTRPIEVYRKAVSTGQPVQQATELAFERASQLVETDLTMSRHDAEVKQMHAQGYTRYRRVIHPELSKGGTCGLCIAASTRIYKTEDLMPLHGRCNCTVAPLAPGVDAGDLLNEQDLDALYRSSGGTSGPQLKRTRYTVNEHGEYGLVLGKHGEEFRGPAQLGKNNTTERAKKEPEPARKHPRRLGEEGCRRPGRLRPARLPAAADRLPARDHRRRLTARHGQPSTR